jgi:hypothetical protein
MVATRAAAKVKEEVAAKLAEEEEHHVAAPYAHLALLALGLAPLVTTVDTNLNILATATLAAGGYREQVLDRR